jgi:hypothetical protein
MDFRLGLSGDHIVITNGSVVKTCLTDQERFARNTAKQSSFNNPFISAVPVIDRGIEANRRWIRMPFLDCDNALVWLSKADAHSIALFAERLIDYLIHAFQSSVIGEFDYPAWQGKIDDLLARIQDEQIVAILRDLRTQRFERGLYYGDYHGDLTLTNLLVFSDGETITIDAIDFLDCFIHTPINDLVKLRQDTNTLWTLQLLKDKHFDTNKVCVALDYIDCQIAKLIDDDPIVKGCYASFQLLSLIRILPYCKDEVIAAYLRGEIERGYRG